MKKRRNEASTIVSNKITPRGATSTAGDQTTGSRLFGSGVPSHVRGFVRKLDSKDIKDRSQLMISSFRD